jgi:DNA-binding NarL/FixJ family response regulator
VIAKTEKVSNFIVTDVRRGIIGLGVSENALVKVYLVEDSPVLRDRVEESIAEDGRLAVVGYADTEEAALAGISTATPDAVILDIQLKRGNGLNVLRRLATLGLARFPKVIVLTNYAEPEYRRRAFAAGCDFFFDKAYEFNRIGEVLGELALVRDPAPD